MRADVLAPAAAFFRSDGGGLPYFIATEGLAEAWMDEGDAAQAQRVLEEAAPARLIYSPSLGVGGHGWMRARLQLADLHRGLGRDTDAREIEADLRARLALADPHHAIRRELARRE
ncbi:MAG TPA: hypothetical protein VGN09_09880 [Vicinamibacteria bacterium]